MNILSRDLNKLYSCILLCALLVVGCSEQPSIVEGGESSAIDERLVMIESVFGPGALVVQKLEILAEVKQYGEIYNLLSADYHAVMSKDVFVSRMNKFDWKVEDISILSVYKHENIHCVIVKYMGECDSNNAKKRVGGVAPVYVEMLEEEWKIINFPFLGYYIRNYPNRNIVLGNEKR